MLKALIAAERRELADVYDGLSADQWSADSLCEGWSVRHLVAHQTMPFRYSTPRYLFELVRSRGDFHAMADRVAHRDAILSPAELVATLRHNAEHPWAPPGEGAAAALTHDVAHGLDVTEALGLGRRVPADRLGPVLERLISPRSLDYFSVALPQVTLRAADFDWTAGSGPEVEAAGQQLVLLLTGRTVRWDHFEGPGVATLRGAATPE